MPDWGLINPFECRSPVLVRNGGGTPPTVNNNFVLVVETTGPAETVTLRCQNVGTFNAEIDWGDGGSSTVTAYNDAGLSHEYATAGEYTVEISGTFPNIFFNNGGHRLKIKEVVQLGDVGWLRLNAGFRGCTNMTSFNGDGDTSLLTRADYMLSGCAAITTLDASGLDTAAVTNMNRMFNGCSGISSLDLTNFDIEAVTDLGLFMNNVTILTADYDAALIAWAAQNPVNGLSAHFGNSQYTSGGAAEAARNKLIATDLWTITDGGAA